MSYLPQLQTSGHGLSSTFTLTPELTPSTSTALWERQTSQQAQLGGAGEDTMEQKAWKRNQRVSEAGVTPTEAPCSSPVGFCLPQIHHKSSYSHKHAKSVLRDLDPRVRFYVTAANASELVTSGKVYTRTATPLWNRALLGQHQKVAQSPLNQGGQDSTERSSPGRSRRREKEALRLNLDVTRITPLGHSKDFALDAVNLSNKDQLPDVDSTVDQLSDSNPHAGSQALSLPEHSFNSHLHSNSEPWSQTQPYSNLNSHPHPNPHSLSQVDQHPDEAYPASWSSTHYHPNTHTHSKPHPHSLPLIYRHPDEAHPASRRSSNYHAHPYFHSNPHHLPRVEKQPDEAHAASRRSSTYHPHPYYPHSTPHSLHRTEQHPDEAHPASGRSSIYHPHYPHSNPHSLPRVEQYPDEAHPARGRSSNYGSASRKLGLPSETPRDGGNGVDSHPVHPFLRMYQTRPGAFARLLSRDPDQHVTRIAPGSTIASLMVRHPSMAGERREGEEEEEEKEEEKEEFEECVVGTTIDMTKNKKRKKSRSRLTLPALRRHAMECLKRRYQLSARQRNNNTNNPNTSSNTDTTDDDNNSNDGSSRGRGGTRIPTAAMVTLSEYPKHFILSSREDDAMMDLSRSLSETDVSTLLRGESRARDELRRLDKEMHSFTDMDYMLPSNLDELLRQEGVDDRVVDTTVALGKVWHDRATYLNHIYHVKRRKYLSRPSRYSSLPPINTPGKTTPPPPSPIPFDGDARRDKRENRCRPWEIPPEPPEDLTSRSEVRTTSAPVIPKHMSLESKARAELENLRTEADILRWETERQTEIISLPPDFAYPRLVLISSKVPRCHSMSKAIRRGDDSIIYIVYDFDNCNFLDLLHICRQRLELYRPGCKAASVLLMCTGAEGCIYMFRKIVLTPQKMRRVQYQDIKMFWRCLGELVSKASSEDSAIHLLGGSLNNTQGKTLLYETQKSLLPNLATVSWVEESTDHGRQVIHLYFDYRKFILWRAKNDSTHLLDYTDITRSWSSLAEEAEDMDTR